MCKIKDILLLSMIMFITSIYISACAPRGEVYCLKIVNDGQYNYVKCPIDPKTKQRYQPGTIINMK